MVENLTGYYEWYIPSPQEKLVRTIVSNQAWFGGANLELRKYSTFGYNPSGYIKTGLWSAAKDSLKLAVDAKIERPDSAEKATKVAIMQTIKFYFEGDKLIRNFLQVDKLWLEALRKET